MVAFLVFLSLLLLHDYFLLDVDFDCIGCVSLGFVNWDKLFRFIAIMNYHGIDGFGIVGFLEFVFRLLGG